MVILSVFMVILVNMYKETKLLVGMCNYEQ